MYVLVRTGYRRVLAESRDPQEVAMQNLDELTTPPGSFYEANPSATLATISIRQPPLRRDQYDAQQAVTP